MYDTRDDPYNDSSDSANFATISAGAGIGVPLVKEGVFIANLVVHMSAPRKWTPEEVALVEETAERTWAAIERARAEAALRASEAALSRANAELDRLVREHTAALAAANARLAEQ